MNVMCTAKSAVIILVCIQCSVLNILSQPDYDSLFTSYLTGLCRNQNVSNVLVYLLPREPTIAGRTILLKRESDIFPNDFNCTVNVDSVQEVGQTYRNGIVLNVPPGWTQYNKTKCEDYSVQLFNRQGNSRFMFLNTTKCLSDGPITFGVATQVRIHFHFNKDTDLASSSGFRMAFFNQRIIPPTSIPVQLFPTNKPIYETTTRKWIIPPKITLPWPRPTHRPTRKPNWIPDPTVFPDPRSDSPTYPYIIVAIIVVVIIAIGVHVICKSFKLNHETRPSTATPPSGTGTETSRVRPTAIPLTSRTFLSTAANPAALFNTVPRVNSGDLNQNYQDDEPPPYPNESPPPYDQVIPTAPFQQK